MSYRNVRTRTLLLCAVAAFATQLAPRVAEAQNPTCASISGGAPILYGAGGSAQTPLVLKAAAVLQTATSPIFVVYKDNAGACSGINGLAALGPTTITGDARYWDNATNSQKTCTLPAGGETIQFASMGNSPLLCPLVAPDPTVVNGILDVTGPISTVNVLVPNASTQQSISAEAFYLVYGLNAAANVAPWNNASSSYYVKRNENSYVQLYLSLATGLPYNKFLGVDAVTNANTITLLGGLANPEQGIGFASGEVADANRAAVRTLAWQQTGQNVGYWPDSSATTFDKINVRTGAYFLWGPGHFYGLKGASPGTYADANVQAFLEYLSGVSQPAGTTKTITEVAIANRNVPVCAMQVNRQGDLGPIYSWAPPNPCGCYFEKQATGVTSCTACDVSTPCPGTNGANVCRYGYCEAY